MQTVSKADSKILKLLQSRQGRKKSPYFICEGLRCCKEALVRQPGWVKTVVMSSSFDPTELPDFDAVTVDEKEFADLTQTENSQGILLLMTKPETTLEKLPAGLIPILDQVNDPGNFGTILRSAWAAGLKPVLYSKGSCDPYGAKTIRSGMGAQFDMTIVQIDSVDELHENYAERTIWMADMDASVSCYDDEFDTSNSFIVMGNEAHGVENYAHAKTVFIPMPGDAESLNVAMAATVLFFEYVRRNNG